MSGARTSAGEWPSRGGDTLPCTALFIETRPFRGAPWAAFEPNDIQLWQRLQRDVEVFLQGLFGQGAFQGSTPEPCLFRQMRRRDLNAADVVSGVVNILVGFAPLKPAAFVVISIQRMTGDATA